MRPLIPLTIFVLAHTVPQLAASYPRRALLQEMDELKMKPTTRDEAQRYLRGRVPHVTFNAAVAIASVESVGNHLHKVAGQTYANLKPRMERLAAQTVTTMKPHYDTIRAHPLSQNIVDASSTFQGHITNMKLQQQARAGARPHWVFDGGGVVMIQEETSPGT